MTTSGEFPAVDRLLGPWLLGEALGGGMSARVYSGVHQASGVEAAIKVLRRDRTRRLQDGVSFLREGRVLKELDHPTIPRLLEMGVAENDRMFLAIQRFPGRDLRAALQGLANRPAPLRRQIRDQLFLPAWLAVTEAVTHAHARGITHGDLTPSNILADGKGVVGLVDWGMARRFDPPPEPTGTEEETPSGIRLHGTPGYVAPETLGADRADATPLSDIYSLGAVLYHLLAFRPAIKARTLPGRLAAALLPVTDPREVAPDMEIPEHLAKLAVAAMSVQPAQRPPSAAACRAAATI